MKKIAFLIYKIIFLFDKILYLIFRKKSLSHFNDFQNETSYKKITILNNKINLFVPNDLIEWRVETFFNKEPDTLEWINTFEQKKIIFWDVGSNVGLYSIYNALRNPESKTISFEPSCLNLRILSRNISINNLQNNISIFPIALSNKKNNFLTMKETSLKEGGALNTFGENFDFEGENIKPKLEYKIFGTNVDFLIDSKILDIPDYIKIDVDGIEHLILEGGEKYFNNTKIKSILVEVNENFKNQFIKIMNYMEKFNFRLLKKTSVAENIGKEKINSKFEKTYNYIFVR